MIRKCIYPKTERVKVEQANVCEITEKLDGSNLCIFKKNDILHIAQRNNIFSIEELEEMKDKLYSGLYAWLLEYGETLGKELRNEACICGEWLRNGEIKI